MLNEKIKKIKAEIDALTTKINGDIVNARKSAESDDLVAAKEMQASINTDKEKLTELKNDLELYESILNEDGAEVGGGQPLNPQNENPTYRESLNAFIRSKGAETEGLTMVGKDEAFVPYNEINPLTDGMKKVDAKPVTSTEISYNPDREILTVIDLKQYVKVHKATKGKGSYPILARPTTRMNSVAELEKNPKLAKPEFKDVDWEVETYRGAIPLSQESIDDADVDLMGIVAENTEGIKVNTTNYAIIETFKKFPKVEVENLDDLKKIYNVSLDPAYVKIMIVSQTVYNWLDTLKDKNGRYLLQDSVVSASGKVFNSMPIGVVNDNQIGEDFGWVGDAKRGVLFADRVNLGLRWADNEIYGQYLQAVCRMDCKVADKEAGRYFNVKAPAPDGTK